jgi:response regulator RpfG family c-di-GMP phosphodiesterase
MVAEFDDQRLGEEAGRSQMTKTVLDVGNCNPDHSAIKKMLTSHYDVQVLRSHQWDDTQKALQSHQVDLVLINRKLDADYSDGMEILKAIKSQSSTQNIPVMIITNYAEHQEAAVAVGGEYGFGKLELESPTTHQRLKRFLETS